VNVGLHVKYVGLVMCSKCWCLTVNLSLSISGD